VDELKKRGQAHISMVNYITFGVVGAVINFIMLFIMTKLFNGMP
jgi:putative flippase GtrA